MAAKWIVAVGAALAGALAGGAAPASAATVTSNWAGYVVTRSAGFGRVSGTWVIPTGSCTDRGRRYSATWVGLGGFARRSEALEQIGTELDCRGGVARHSAWYELVPAASKRIRMKLRPGDVMSASVAVHGTRVSLRLRDKTSGATFARTLRMAAPDTSSAEWIVEAPSECDDRGACATLPLADFGTVQFSHAAARTRAGHRGGIADAAWRTHRVELVETSVAGDPRFIAHDAASGAVASPLISGGRGFSVGYRATQAPPPGSPQTLPG